jgi:hypothetical protein
LRSGSKGAPNQFAVSPTGVLNESRYSRAVTLGLRTILGFVALLLVVGAALFVPAATLNYWQGWLYVVRFFGATAAISLYLWRADPKLLERRAEGGPLAEGEASQRLIQSVAGLAFIGLLVVPSVDHRFGWSHVPLPLSIVAMSWW